MMPEIQERVPQSLFDHIQQDHEVSETLAELEQLMKNLMGDISLIKSNHTQTKDLSKYQGKEIPNPLEDTIYDETQFGCKHLSSPMYQTKKLANLFINKQGVTIDVIRCLSDLAYSYAEQELYPQALEHAQKALMTQESQDPFHEKADSSWNELICRNHLMVALGKADSAALKEAQNHIKFALFFMKKLVPLSSNECMRLMMIAQSLLDEKNGIFDRACSTYEGVMTLFLRES
jgi:hypothetical protein